MGSRGQSGLSLVVGVDKPSGMTSHDVVNRARRVFGERRVGHAGTLDPLASGVLAVCVGPATRLSGYLSGQDKGYRAGIAFGTSTDTDDAEGQVLNASPVPGRLFDPDFAADFVAGLVGTRKQLPPAYSAIKVGGRKSYEAARAGTVIDLTPREVTVHEARFLGMRRQDGPAPLVWDVELRVSKGTYVRALARDAGVALGCPAHLESLVRTRSGGLAVEDCVGLEALERVGVKAAVDPVRLLGCRVAFLDEEQARPVANGAALPGRGLRLFRLSGRGEACSCTSGVCESGEEPVDGELVAMLRDNRLVALYGYDGTDGRWRARCVFQTGVSRGEDI